MSYPVEGPGISTHDQNLLSYEQNTKNSSTLQRLAAGFLTAAVLATTITTGEVILGEVSPARADTGDYPDWNKPCVAPGDPQYGQSEGVGLWCNDYQWGDLATGQQTSSRGYAYRNCTDWVAWRIPQLISRDVPTGWSNGKLWDDRAAAAGYTVDNTPEPGDIAVWEAGTYGHVEAVESVNANGTANTSGYNKHQNGTYNTQSGVIADHYIDLNGTGKGINGEDLGNPPEQTTNPYTPKNITVVPNILGGLSVFAASDAGLMGYKDQTYPGEDLATKPWGSIPEHLIGQPEIVQYPNGALSVFGHGDATAHHLYHAWQTGPGTAWSGDISPWNVSLRGEPSAAFNFTGGVSVFFPDSNGEMREIDQIGQGGDLGTAPVHDLGGNLQGKPAVMNINGALALFAHGADGLLKIDFQSTQGGSWSGWQNIGGQHIKGDPRTFINRLGGMSVIAIGEGGDIVGIDQSYQGESMNKPFYSLAKPAGVEFAGTPAVIQTTNGEQMVFATSTSGILYHKAQVRANHYNWTDFFLLGGNFIGAPTVVRNAAGGASIFGRNPDGTVITLDQPGYGASFNTGWIGVGVP